MKVFAYLDLDFSPTAWAVMRGALVSVNVSNQKNPDGFISFMHAGMIRHQRNDRIYNETIIEHIRRCNHPGKLSRLQSLYFFSEQDTARHALNWGGHFLEKNLFELELCQGTATTRCDSNWITYAPLQGNGMLDTRDLSWVDKYWSGIPFNDTPAWEILADGIALVLDESVRRRCAENLERQHRNSQIPILMSRIASEVGTLGGLTVPFLKKLSNTEVELCYLFRDEEFHDHTVINQMKSHPDIGNLGALMSQHEEWNMPDFREYFQKFTIQSNIELIGQGITIPSVHY